MKTTNRLINSRLALDPFGHSLPSNDKPVKVLEFFAGAQSFILFRGRCTREEWSTFLKENNAIEAGNDGLLLATTKTRSRLPAAASIFASLNGDHLAQAHQDLFGTWHYQDSCPQALACGGNYFLARLAYS